MKEMKKFLEILSSVLVDAKKIIYYTCFGLLVVIAMYHLTWWVASIIVVPIIILSEYLEKHISHEYGVFFVAWNVDGELSYGRCISCFTGNDIPYKQVEELIKKDLGYKSVKVTGVHKIK